MPKTSLVLNTLSSLIKLKNIDALNLIVFGKK